MNRVGKNFSHHADRYDARAHFQRTQAARVADAALMLLPQQARVLDIGCGTGVFAQLTASRRPQWRWLGLDIAAGMCAHAAAHGQVLRGDACALPLADNSVDAVVSSLCLQWIADPGRAMAEIARVLRPGGRAVLLSLGARTLEELRAAADAAHLPLALLPMRPVEDYRNAIAKAGLNAIHFEREQQKEYHPSMRGLLDSMRAIGAGMQGGPIGPKRWRAMEALFEANRTQDGLPLSWDVLFMILSKPQEGA